MRMQEGQSLFVVIMLIAIVVSSVIIASHRLNTELQNTTLQEESIRVLAAADSGVEKALQLDTYSEGVPITYQDLGITLSGIDTSKSSIKIDSNATHAFISPFITKNNQYTFYLSTYSPNGDFSSADYYDGYITLYLGSEGGGTCSSSRDIPALEVTYIYGSSNDQIKRWIIEPCSTGNEQVTGNASDITRPAANSQTLVYNERTETFSHFLQTNSIQIRGTDAPKLLILRVLFADTYIGFTSNIPSNIFMPQGKNIRSEARSINGVSKVITVHQSLPQIPAEFFVTQF